MMFLNYFKQAGSLVPTVQTKKLQITKASKLALILISTIWVINKNSWLVLEGFVLFINLRFIVYEVIWKFQRPTLWVIFCPDLKKSVQWTSRHTISLWNTYLSLCLNLGFLGMVTYVKNWRLSFVTYPLFELSGWLINKRLINNVQGILIPGFWLRTKLMLGWGKSSQTRTLRVLQGSSCQRRPSLYLLSKRAMQASLPHPLAFKVPSGWRLPFGPVWLQLLYY